MYTFQNGKVSQDANSTKSVLQKWHSADMHSKKELTNKKCESLEVKQNMSGGRCVTEITIVILGQPVWEHALYSV